MRSRSAFAVGQEKRATGRHQPTVHDGRRRSQYMPTAVAEDVVGGASTKVPWGMRTVLESGDCGMIMERIDAACATPWLSHPTATRAIYGLDGQVFLRVGGEQITLRRGEFRLIQPGEKYQLGTGTMAALLMTVQVPDYFEELVAGGQPRRNAVIMDPPLPPRTNGSMAAAALQKEEREAQQRSRRSGR